MQVITNDIKVDPRSRCGGLFGFGEGCFSICIYNLVRHNKDVLFAWEGDCDIPHWIGEKFQEFMCMDTF